MDLRVWHDSSSDEVDAVVREKTAYVEDGIVEVGRQEHDAMESRDGDSMSIDIAQVSNETGGEEEEDGRSCTCPEHAHGPFKNPVEYQRCHHQC